MQEVAPGTRLGGNEDSIRQHKEGVHSRPGGYGLCKGLEMGYYDPTSQLLVSIGGQSFSQGSCLGDGYWAGRAAVLQP